MSQYVLSARAQRDLREIRDWIEDGNPARAVSYVAGIADHFSRIAAMPLMGRSRDDLGPRLRSVVHGRLLIFS